MGDQTTFSSLQLGTDSGAATGLCDSGYPCAYQRNISWAGPTTPLPKLTNPTLVFERLFGGFDSVLTDAQRDRRRRYRTSVLDHALEDAKALQAKVAVDDRHRLDEYLTGVATGAASRQEPFRNAHRRAALPSLSPSRSRWACCKNWRSWRFSATSPATSPS